MKLPPTFFYKFFKENTFFVVDNAIYNPRFSSSEIGFISVGDKKFGLDEGLKLSRLEELYFSNNDSELKNCCNNLLKSILTDEKEINRDYYELGEDLEFIEFVWYDLLRKKKTAKPKIKLIKVKEKNPFLIDEIFSQDCFVWKGKLYALEKGKGLFNVKIKNKSYSIGESLESNLEELEKKYLKKIEEKVYNQLTKGQDSLLSRIGRLKEKKDLIDIIRKGEFFDAKENIGFKKDVKGFFVTTKAGKGCNGDYILYEPNNGKYYRFEEALIGIKLVKQDESISWWEPVVINPYIHPSLPSKRPTPHQKICEGNFDYKQAVKGCDLASAIRILLGEARRLILSGYYGASGAHSSLSAGHFQELEVKSFDATEVTNEYA